MLSVDTDVLKQYAQKFHNQLASGFIFDSVYETYRHQQIQNGLMAISSYLISTASQFEANDDAIAGSNWSFQSFMNPNLYPLLTKKEGGPNAHLSMQYGYLNKEYSYSNEYVYSSLDINVGSFRAKGDAQFSLWKEGQLYPNLSVKASAAASLFSMQTYARMGTENIYADVKTNATVGVLYANAEATLNPYEQTLDVGIGGSALKGEVEASFHVFGVKLTLTGQGSVGSAELNMSYHHSNREWEFGSKLGFIVGTGFKVKVQY